MKKFVYLLAFGILLFGCGSKQIPDWLSVSFNQLENYKNNYLSGKDRIAELQFNKAVEEIRSSGNLEILGRAYLTKHAVQVAVLEVFDDTEYLKINALQPVLSNSNFHNFLKGSFDKVDESLLPGQYYGFLKALRKGNTEAISREISHMEDPLSKLIAVGLLVKMDNFGEMDLHYAIDTASRNGWKKAVLSYLNKLRAFYEKKGETEKAAATKRKIELLKK